MNLRKNFFKYISILAISILTLSLFSNDEISNIRKISQTSLYKSFRVVKVTEERSKINDNKISININMPEIYYTNTKVERYINTYIRKSINDYVNNQRQIIDLDKNEPKKYIDISYHVAFEDKNLLNIIIYRNKTWNKDNFEFEKDSYVFDLKTGQRVYLDNFLKNNEDYKEVITNYIESNKLTTNKEKINIDKYTNYIIIEDGIEIYFNPYKTSSNNIINKFKIPSEIFKNKIRIVETNDIVANIDTQTITKNNKYINSVINIPIIMIDNKEIEKGINDEIRNDIMKFYNESQLQAKDYQKDLPDEQNKFVANSDFEIKKNSDNILSLVVEYYKYSGGAHGYYEDVAYNIDIRTGKNIKLQDLFKDEYDYKNIINKSIISQIEQLVIDDPQNIGIFEFSSI